MKASLRKDGRWIVWVRVAKGEKGRRPFYGRTAEEALEAANDFLQPSPIPVYEPGTFAHLVYGKWRAHVKDSVEKTTWAKYAGQLVHHILPAIGHLHLKRITEDDMLSLLKGLRRADKRPGELSKRERREILLRCREIFKFARQRGLMGADPSELIRLPKAPRKRERIEPEPGFAEQLLAHVRGHWIEGPIFAALFLAMREGEVAGLKWPKIDRRELTLTIDKQRHPLKDEGTPKGDHCRSFEITQEIVDILDRLGDHNNLFVFTDGKGRPVSPNAISKLAPKVIVEAGLPRCTFHDLRSYAASNLADMGVHPLTIMAILGHSDLKTTLRYLDSKKRARRKAIGDYVASVMGGQQ